MKQARQTSEPPKPMLEALQQQTCDGRLKAVAFRFLQDDLTKLRSEADFRKAYHGLIVCQQLLGPIDANYRKTLDDMRKILDSYASRADGWMELREAFEAGWDATIMTLESVVPRQDWPTVKEHLINIRNTFSKYGGKS